MIAFYFALKHGNLYTIEIFLSHGANINSIFVESKIPIKLFQKKNY